MRVVCIVDFLPRPGGENETLPIKGNIYTVREKRTIGSRIGYLFYEIINTPQIYSDSGDIELECGFDVDGFRPVTDISALTKLTKVRELEDA